MTYPALGNYSLAGAMLASIAAVYAAVLAGRSDSPGAMRAARWSIHAITAMLTLACGALLAAILKDDFALEYVAGHSERALHIAYKIAAFWAGHEGSLLLWAWLTAATSSIAVIVRAKDPRTTQAPMIGLLGGVNWFFCLILLFAASPFKLVHAVLPDGLGLNPLLHHPAMIAHPVLLFIGYAAFTVPFALYIGAMIGGRSDKDWIRPVRNWVMGSWAFLTAGIILGSWWAYVELGWGGYWAWDPVENASLFPWFTATALMHSLIAQQRRGMLKVWNAVLIPLTFILCIFGTFLTRTGIVASVHSFPDTGIGALLIMMMVVCAAIPIGVLIWRRCLLRSDRPFQRLISMGGAFTAACWLLLLMTVATLVGTVYPLIVKPFTETPEMLGQEFYNIVVIPMGLVLIGLMGIAPLLRFAGTPGGMRRRLVLPIIVTHLGVILVGFLTRQDAWFIEGALNSRKLWTAVSAGIITFAVITIAQDFVLTATARWRDRKQNLLITTLQSLRGNLRRYGGQVVHLGMVMIVAGVVGSSLYETEADLSMAPNQSDKLGRYLLRYDSFEENSHPTYLTQEASMTLVTADGKELALRPQKRRYFKPASQNTTSEVAVHSSLFEDVYLILSDWWIVDQDDPQNAQIKVKIKALVKPLLIWIWIGGIAMTAGALICLFSPGAKKKEQEVRR